MRFVIIARAVVVGVTTALAVKYGVVGPLSVALRGMTASHPFARVTVAAWVPSLLGVAVWVAAGWVVARTHRAQPVAAVAAFVVFVNVWQLPRAYAVLRNALDDPRFVPGLVTFGTEIAMVTAGILVGARLANLGRPRIPERVTPVL